MCKNIHYFYNNHLNILLSTSGIIRTIIIIIAVYSVQHWTYIRLRPFQLFSCRFLYIIVPSDCKSFWIFFLQILDHFLVDKTMNINYSSWMAIFPMNLSQSLVSLSQSLPIASILQSHTWLASHLQLVERIRKSLQSISLIICRFLRIFCSLV